MDAKDIAMDFFRGLDNAQYASFKTEIKNGLTSKAFEQPENLNAMYLLAIISGLKRRPRQRKDMRRLLPLLWTTKKKRIVAERIKERKIRKTMKTRRQQVKSQRNLRRI